MYLSRLILNPRSTDALRDASSEYEMHSTLARAFKDAPKAVKEQQFKDLPREAKERVLFRIETEPETGLKRVLVQSYHQPDWSFLNKDYLLSLPDEPNPNVKSIDPQFAASQLLFFRLRSNPTKRLPPQNGRDGKRVCLYAEDEQIKLLERKLREAGAELLKCQVIPQGLKNAHKHREDDRKQTHFAVLFEGMLKVNDPDLLRAAVENGIGPAKGYGFGLLSLARAS